MNGRGATAQSGGGLVALVNEEGKSQCPNIPRWVCNGSLDTEGPLEGTGLAPFKSQLCSVQSWL